MLFLKVNVKEILFHLPRSPESPQELFLKIKNVFLVFTPPTNSVTASLMNLNRLFSFCTCSATKPVRKTEIELGGRFS